MNPLNRSILDVLSAPRLWRGLDAQAIDALLRQAARGAVLATLAHRLAEVVPEFPGRVRDRFDAAEVMATEHARRLRFGLRLAAQALARSNIPVVVLKGGAYLLGGFPNAAGRLTSDLDLLVPESRLTEAEALFVAAGWKPETGDEYEQRFYREWMHELPPLRHPHHGVTIDLHHNLSPRTGRLDIDPGELFARAVPLGGDTPFLRLADEDLTLHLCIHLFHDGEFHHGLRELLDLDGVMRHCMTDESAWARLLERAGQLGVTRPLYYGCHFAAQLLGTPVPVPVQARLADRVFRTPGQRLGQAAMAACLLPVAGDRPTLGRRIAETILLMRAHWLRMPPGLLFRHLATQAWRRGGLKTKSAH